MRFLEARIPPPLVALAAAAAMWGLERAAPGLGVALPGKLWIALGLAGLGLGLDLAGVAAFQRARTTVNPLSPQNASAIVTGGVYRITRNPMYLGMALILAGWAAWLANPLGLLALLAFILWIDRLQIAPEERALAAKFGADYEAYRRRVRRWI